MLGLASVEDDVRLSTQAIRIGVTRHDEQNIVRVRTAPAAVHPDSRISGEFLKSPDQFTDCQALS